MSRPASPLRGYVLAKATRGSSVIAKTDGSGNKLFLCGCIWVEEREAATASPLQQPRA